MVVIKRVKKPEQYFERYILPFVSYYIIDIKDIYCENNEITIIYKQMDVSFRQIINILSG